MLIVSGPDNLSILGKLSTLYGDNVFHYSIFVEDHSLTICAIFAFLSAISEAKISRVSLATLFQASLTVSHVFDDQTRYSRESHREKLTFLIKIGLMVWEKCNEKHIFYKHHMNKKSLNFMYSSMVS